MSDFNLDDKSLKASFSSDAQIKIYLFLTHIVQHVALYLICTYS